MKLKVGNIYCIGYNDSVDEARQSFLEDLKYELETFDKDDQKEVYFHDIMHDTLDNLVSSNDRATNLSIIDDTGNENDIDEGMIDRNADISMQIAQIAYCCLETELFNDDFIQELQTKLNNESITGEEAQELIEKIDDNI